MLGLNDGAKAKSWVLLAEYKDNSAMRNATAFYLGSQILGVDGYYVSDYIYAEVYVNSTYRGLYLLCEQHQVNENRVDINEPDEGNDDYKAANTPAEAARYLKYFIIARMTWLNCTLEKLGKK